MVNDKNYLFAVGMRESLLPYSRYAVNRYTMVEACIRASSAYDIFYYYSARRAL